MKPFCFAWCGEPDMPCISRQIGQFTALRAYDRNPVYESAQSRVGAALAERCGAIDVTLKKSIGKVRFIGDVIIEVKAGREAAQRLEPHLTPIVPRAAFRCAHNCQVAVHSSRQQGRTSI